MLSANEASEKTNNLLNKLGCKYLDNNKQLICAKNLSIDVLSSDKTLNSLVIDNIVFEDSIDKLLENSKFKNCNIIAGYNSREFYSTLEHIFPDLLDVLNIDYDVLKTVIKYYFTIHGHPIENGLIKEILQKYQIPMVEYNKLKYMVYANQIHVDKKYFCPIKKMTDYFTAAGMNAYVYRYAFPVENEEQIKSYWTTFVKFNDPSGFEKSVKLREYYIPYSENDLNLDIDEFPVIFEKSCNFFSKFNFSMHNCDFWNNL